MSIGTVLVFLRGAIYFAAYLLAKLYIHTYLWSYLPSPIQFLLKLSITPLILVTYLLRPILNVILWCLTIPLDLIKSFLRGAGFMVEMLWVTPRACWRYVISPVLHVAAAAANWALYIAGAVLILGCAVFIALAFSEWFLARLVRCHHPNL